MDKKTPIFKQLFITPDLLKDELLNSIFIKVRYLLPGETFRIADIEICYFKDLDVNENIKDIMLNLKNRLFLDSATIKYSVHNYTDKIYLVIPQSYFLNQEYFFTMYHEHNFVKLDRSGS